MEIIAQTKSVRISPRKVRLVADAVRKLSVEQALQALAVVKKRGSLVIEKTLRSALANAVNNKSLSEESLFIKAIDVTEGPALKRFHASTRGRVHPFKKKSSHIRIVLAEKAAKQVQETVKKSDNQQAKIKDKKSNIKSKESASVAKATTARQGEEIK